MQVPKQGRNLHRESAFYVALVAQVVRDGAVVNSFYSLIHPEPDAKACAAIALKIL